MAIIEYRSSLEFTQLAEVPSANGLEKVAVDLFGSCKEWHDFCNAFQNHFPMSQAFQRQKFLRFSPEAIQAGKISCEGAAALMYYWARARKPEYSAFFLTERRSSETHANIAFVQTTDSGMALSTLQEGTALKHQGKDPIVDTLWFHLTLSDNLHLIKHPSMIPYRALEEAVREGINSNPFHDLTVSVPTYQLFTTPQILREYCLLDYSFRTLGSSSAE